MSLPVGPLLVKHTVSTLLAADGVTSLEGDLGVAITAQVSDGLVVVKLGWSGEASGACARGCSVGSGVLFAGHFCGSFVV